MTDVRLRKDSYTQCLPLLENIRKITKLDLVLGVDVSFSLMPSSTSYYMIILKIKMMN